MAKDKAQDAVVDEQAAAPAQQPSSPELRLPGTSRARQKLAASGAYIRNAKNPRYNEIKGRNRPA